MVDSTTSFIEPFEEQIAKDFIREQLDFEPPKPCGYYILVKLYIRPEEMKTITTEDGKEVTLYAPDSVRAEDRFRTCTALVLALGPECYKGENFKESGPWCKAGDWVVIPRNEGTQIMYNEHVVHLIPDDRILMVIPDPTIVRRC
jgi:co-chaperonin GroES (HSP10)